VPASELRKAVQPDPFLIHASLPLRATYHPLGFAIEITTNSAEALQAAEESWGAALEEFDAPPMRIRIVVHEDAGRSPDPVYRGQGHLLAIVGDAANFAVCDGDALSAFCFAGAETVRRRTWFRWFFLEAMTAQLLTQRLLVPLHAGCVSRDGDGVLLCGASGAGKSTLAFACARAGWTYVCDDAAMLLQDSDEPVAIGSSRQARFREDAASVFPELSRYIPQTRPNGKSTIEAPMTHFPGIATAARSRIGAIVFLVRQGGAGGGVRPVVPGEALERLLAELPAYREEIRARHERELRKLVALPAVELHYGGVAEAIQMLGNLIS
jgi:hypothetical protein